MKYDEIYFCAGEEAGVSTTVKVRMLDGESSTAFRAMEKVTFAYVSHAVPSVMLALAAGQPEKGHRHP